LWRQRHRVAANCSCPRRVAKTSVPQSTPFARQVAASRAKNRAAPLHRLLEALCHQPRRARCRYRDPGGGAQRGTHPARGGARQVHWHARRAGREIRARRGRNNRGPEPNQASATVGLQGKLLYCLDGPGRAAPAQKPQFLRFERVGCLEEFLKLLECRFAPASSWHSLASPRAADHHKAGLYCFFLQPFLGALSAPHSRRQSEAFCVSNQDR
jgi:hypothetical protein